VRTRDILLLERVRHFRLVGGCQPVRQHKLYAMWTSTVPDVEQHPVGHVAGRRIERPRWSRRRYSSIIEVFYYHTRTINTSMFTVLNGLKQIAVALLLLLVFVLHTKINTTKGNTLYSSLEHLNKRVMLI